MHVKLHVKPSIEGLMEYSFATRALPCPPVPRARVATKAYYWLNNRRVAGEPAGMPACSSLA